MNGEAPAQPGRRLHLFAFGDFGFNLYWQSLSLFLLFYYTDTLGVSIADAAMIYFIASLFDGVAGFLFGLWIDRRARPEDHGKMLVRWSAPLGLAFVLAYAPPAGGDLRLAILCVSQILLRIAYAFANIYYLAMSARVSLRQQDRSLVAGARMVWGAIAAVIVSLATRPLGLALTGSERHAYFAAAVVFAIAGAAILALVGATFRDATPSGSFGAGAARNRRPTFRALLDAIIANQSFLSVAAAMVTMIIAVTMVSKMVLYYFKYAIGSTRAGEFALADMALIGLVAVPLWMIFDRRFGARRTWAAASFTAMLLLAALALAGSQSALAAQLILAAFQGAAMGLDFALWALLPATIDDGERRSGARVEAALFGLVGMLQRMAIGAATWLVGVNLGLAGHEAGEPLTAAASLAMRLQISVIPLFFLAASAVFILRRRAAG